MMMMILQQEQEQQQQQQEPLTNWFSMVVSGTHPQEYNGYSSPPPADTTTTTTTKELYDKMVNNFSLLLMDGCHPYYDTTKQAQQEHAPLPSCCSTTGGSWDQSSEKECPVALLSKVLKWIKLIVLRIAHTYGAQTTLLVLLPLSVGLLLGYLLFAPSSSSSLSTTNTLMQQEESTDRVQKEEQDPADKTTAMATPLLLDKNQDTDDEQADFPPPSSCPRHIAVIMDGNRRYGRRQHPQSQSPQHDDDHHSLSSSSMSLALSGHVAGAQQVRTFCQWCLEAGIPMVTLYAFSTENWHRSPTEVSHLMTLFVQQCKALQHEYQPASVTPADDDKDDKNEEAPRSKQPRSKQKQPPSVQVEFLVTDPYLLPAPVRRAMRELQTATQDNTQQGRGGLRLRICLSYGSRQEIVQTCQALAHDCCRPSSVMTPEDISESVFAQRLTQLSHSWFTGSSPNQNENATTTNHHDSLEAVPDPDLLIRTSGEVRLSNFLLWQLAYTELFFVPQTWPELQRHDLVRIVRTYATQRQRRFGK